MSYRCPIKRRLFYAIAKLEVCIKYEYTMSIEYYKAMKSKATQELLRAKALRDSSECQKE